MYLVQLADYLRSEGLRVVEHGRWWELGRPSGAFRPIGVGWHHTAVRSDRGNPAPSVRLVTEGRADLAGPLCHLLPAWDGIVHVIAAGRANHGGASDGVGTGPIPSGDANALLVGLEIDYHPDYQDGPSPAQYRASIAAAAAVLRLLRNLGHIPTLDASRARGHYEWSTTGKWDPGRLGRRTIDLSPWRADLAAALSRLPGAWYLQTSEEDIVTPEDRKAIEDGVVARLAPLLQGATSEATRARQEAASARQEAASARQEAAAARVDARAAHDRAARAEAGIPPLIGDVRQRVVFYGERQALRTTAQYGEAAVTSYEALAASAAAYDDFARPPAAGPTAGLPDKLVVTGGTLELGNS